MRLLYFTDTHIRGTNPKNRIDDFPQTLENKLNEIVDIIKVNRIDYVIHGGDLFDRPDISISVVSRFSKILKSIMVPFYIISGNHDIFGHNPLTVNRTILGLLNQLDFLTIINENQKIILEEGNKRIQLTGKPYSYDIDTDLERSGYILKERAEDVDLAIHIVHGMLLDKPFVKGVPFTLLEDIKNTKADITLSGHYHSGFNTVEIDGKYFINPGALVRITNSLREIDRIPQIVIIDIGENINLEYIKLKSALNGEIVLDRSEVEKYVFKSEQLYEFKQIIDSTLEFEKMDINDVLIEVSFAEGLSDEVKKEALKRIADIQIRGLAGDD
ncbi:metallophosphoesterase [Tissierella creatinini]|nr:metallophosphoesterase [Tissierella creatinini]TJX69137.1 metallophosphoesterase [Soehngenia saccharolytica]